MWEIFICIGVNWAGCGSIQTASYQNEESCYRAIREMRVGDSPIGESSAKRNTVAYCKPKQPDNNDKR